MMLYRKLANDLINKINLGFFKSGERLPSIRTLSDSYSVSISTVQQALRLIENMDMIYARPGAGYYVLSMPTNTICEEMKFPVQVPVTTEKWYKMNELYRKMPKEKMLNLDNGIPLLNLRTLQPLYRELSQLYRKGNEKFSSFISTELDFNFKIEICRLLINSGVIVNPNELVITNGCHSSLSLLLMAICQPGDVIAVESPFYLGVMQILHSQNLKIIEIPTNLTTGICINTFENILSITSIKALIVVPTCNNPSGYCMPDENKAKLLDLADEHDFILLEDNVYGDLNFFSPRAKAIKASDGKDKVILYGSFSKTVSPDLKIGWVLPGRFLQKVSFLKFCMFGSDNKITQQAMYNYIKSGGYKNHLVQIKKIYKRNLSQYLNVIQRAFPSGTKVSQPNGGFFLWNKLPAFIRNFQDYEYMLENNVYYSPGHLFSYLDAYSHCLRISYAQPLTSEIQNTLEMLGQRFKQQ